MKRLFIALMALTTVLQIEAANILSLDDLSPSKTYYIRTINGGYLYADTDKAKYDGLSSPTADDAYRWVVAKTKATGQVFIYNLKADAFLSASNGECPLMNEPVIIQLLTTGQQGIWIGFAEGQVIALNSASSSANQILLLDESSETPDFLSFEEAGTLSADQEMSIAAKAKVYETNRTNVPVISAIGTAITNVSQLTDGLTFLFYSTGKNRYAYDAGEALSFNDSPPALNNITVMPYVFVAHKVGDAWMFSTAEGRYISGFSGGVSTGGEGITFTVTPSATEKSFNLYNANSSMYLNATNEKPVGWGDSEGNSRYQIIPVTLTNSNKYYPVTYLCYESDGENIRLMDIQTYAKTSNRLTPPAFTGFKRTAIKQANGEAFTATKVTEPTVAVCTYTRQLRKPPVVPTTITDGEFADTTRWYRIRVNEKYMQWSADAPGHYYLRYTSLPTMDDSDLWCFVGNNVNGYRIYNRAVGTSLPLAFMNEPLSSDLPFLCDGAFNEWSISNGSSTGYWYVSPVGTKKQVYLCDDGQGKLSVYGSATNVSIDEAATEMQAFAETAAANLGSHVGQYVSAGVEALVNASEGYVLSKAAFNTLQTAYNDFAHNASRVELCENMLYRFINVNASDATLRAEIDATVISQNEREESARTQLWQLLPVGATDRYYLLNPESGLFIGQTSSGKTPTLVKTPTTHSYTISNVPNTIAQWRLRDATYYVSLNDENAVVGGSASAEKARWFIEPVRTFTVETVSNNEGIATATLFLPFAVELPEGISAMAVTAKGANSVELASFDSNIVPANTPCVLISGSAGSFLLTETSAEGTSPDGNLLSGVAVRSNGDGNTSYQLDANGNFTPATAMLAAYSAVLPREAGDAETLSLTSLTGIEQLSVDELQNSSLYDLSGRRLLTAPRINGVYILNGKKILVR